MSARSGPSRAASAGRVSAAQTIAARKAEIVARHGPWYAHDIDLGGGVATLADGHTNDWRLQIVDGLLAARGIDEVRGLRILDLACHEGLFAIEFARRGARTIGIEIREAHLAKARFAAEALGLADCHILKGDVRALPADLGVFDLVFCAGILYHLDFPDCIALIGAVAAHTKGLALFDTHVAPPLGAHARTHGRRVARLSRRLRTVTHEGVAYQGRTAFEHHWFTPPALRRRLPLSSIDNRRSFWLTEDSLKRAIEAAGLALVDLTYAAPDHKAWSRAWAVARRA